MSIILLNVFIVIILLIFSGQDLNTKTPDLHICKPQHTHKHTRTHTHTHTHTRTHAHTYARMHTHTHTHTHSRTHTLTSLFQNHLADLEKAA